MSEATRTMKNKGQEIGSGVGQAASSAADTARTTAGQIQDTARETAAHLAKEGRQAASYVGNMAEDATSAVGSGLKSVGQSIREHSPQEGRLGHATTAVADTLEGTGRYLQEEGLRGLGSDLTQMIKNNPLPSLLIGVGLGYLLAQASTPRR